MVNGFVGWLARCSPFAGGWRNETCELQAVTYRNNGCQDPSFIYIAVLGVVPR